MLPIGLFSHVVVGKNIEDRSWHRLTQAGVELITDLAPPRAEALLGELALFRPVVDDYIPGREGFEDDLQIILFSRRRDFSKLFKPRHFGAFTLPRLRQTRLVIAPSAERDSLRKNLLHEYVHYRMRAGIDKLAPAWFEEGLATMLAAVEFTTSATSDSAAQPTRSALGRWPGFVGLETFPLRRLLDKRGVEDLSEEAAQSFYATSHLLVRELLLKQSFPPAALDGFVYEQNPTIDQLFERSRTEIERRLARSIERRSSALAVAPLVVKSASAAVQVAPIAAEEMLQLLGESVMSVNPKAAEALFSRLAKRSVDSAAGWLGTAAALERQEKQQQALQAFERAQQLEPDAPEVHIARALLHTADCPTRVDAECFAAWKTAVADLRRGLFDAPDRFDAIYRLGQAHLYLGQPGEAISYLAIAAQRAPWSARVNYYLGEAYRMLGDSRARTHLERAERWAGSEFYEALAQASLAELANPGASSVPNVAR